MCLLIESCMRLSGYPGITLQEVRGGFQRIKNSTALTIDGLLIYQKLQKFIQKKYQLTEL